MATSITITLPDPLAAELQAAAEKYGLTTAAFVTAQLEMSLADGSFDGIDPDTSADGAAIAAFEQSGVAVPGDEVVAWLKSLETDQPLPPPRAQAEVIGRHGAVHTAALCTG